MFHKVLEQNYGSSKRFATLMHAGIGTNVSALDQETLMKHGVKKAAFQGDEMPAWLQKYTAEVLRFAEFERRVLPYKLMEALPDGESCPPSLPPSLLRIAEFERRVLPSKLMEALPRR